MSYSKTREKKVGLGLCSKYLDLNVLPYFIVTFIRYLLFRSIAEEESQDTMPLKQLTRRLCERNMVKIKQQ